MNRSFYKGIVLGTATAVITLTAATALAGTGIGGVFNLGVDNTVDGQTLLRGNTGGNPQLRVNNQQGSDGAIGVLGAHSAGAGGGAGVQGDSASTTASATGVFGRVTSPNAAAGSAAVRGINSGAGMGVYGRNGNNVPFAYGVSGEGRYGVTGSALFSGASSGVYGSAPNGFAGVEGHTGNANGYGVYGRNNGATTAGGAGVFGTHPSASGTGAGVMGETNSSSPNATGILARANATNPGRDAVALRAINKSANSFGMGVWGSVDGAGWGVLGEAGASGIGVIGKLAGAGTGVHGLAGSGGIGVKGIGGKTGVYGQATDSTGFAFAANGDAGQARTAGGWVKAMALIDWHRAAGQQVLRCYNSQVAPGTPGCGISAASSSTGYWRIDFGFDVSDRFLLVTPWHAARGDWSGVVANATPVSGGLVDVTLAYNGGHATNTIFNIVVL